MDTYRELMKKARAHELILGGLFVLYSGLDVETPSFLAEFANSGLGVIVILAFAISLFAYLNPIVAVLGLVACYELIRRSRGGSLVEADKMISYLPQTQPNCRDLNAYNQFSKTLEQEMVQKMAPLTGPSVGEVSYKPELEDDHDASPISNH